VNVDSWNILTTHWLRHCVYERVHPSIGTWVVFLVSAFWHGFYPGYYIAFLTAALFTTAARLVRVVFSCPLLINLKVKVIENLHRMYFIQQFRKDIDSV